MTEILITPTTEIAAVNGAPVRVWQGRTTDGKVCKVYVALVGFPTGQTPADLEADLVRVRPTILPNNPEVN